ncbi:hypothetical protein [Nonomuraea africana]|uniref:Exo-alpha-sialidase n=1 Tax=Nonomuraea africana TaxID=46171 RepID=A0ABR9KR35_9ACTN|nr:hypothetical protein [Nonomuraea africana]MBE1564485.1 hypothetical protein [Nonomuraea africana]
MTSCPCGSRSRRLELDGVGMQRGGPPYGFHPGSDHPAPVEHLATYVGPGADAFVFLGAKGGFLRATRGGTSWTIEDQNA